MKNYNSQQSAVSSQQSAVSSQQSAVSSQQSAVIADENTPPSENLFAVPGATPNFQTELAAQLAELLPEVIVDGKLDIEKLRELLADDVTDNNERFGLFWPGKKRALRAAQAPTTATLKPDFANSKDWDSTQNAFIEGDNLEVLKVLQRHYHNKVKLIYIDPPYNTGKDFVYPDNYQEGLDSYLEWTRQVNEEGKKVSSNSDTEGRYHSNWLNMMYPRLKLARNLLTDDGVIFISIDDNEMDNLKKLCNEIFGESNFVATFIWEKRTNRENRKVVSSRHDYILCYARRQTPGIRTLKQLPMSAKALANYKNPDNDPRGLWKSDPATAQAGHGTKDQFYILTAPNGKPHELESGRCWLYTEKVMKQEIAEGKIWFGKTGHGVPRIKTYLDAKERGLTPESILFAEEAGTNESSKNLLKELFSEVSVFDTPKPVDLIGTLIKLACEDGLVLDFFAGVSTTAHAVMALNAEDGGNRRFIMVQLPEPTPEGSEARKAGFKTIADISRQRIQLAGEKIKAASPLTTQDLDTGFRAYKLADTNFAKWQVSSDIEPDKLEQRLLDLRDSADDGASPDDLLTEILLKLGFALTETIDCETIAGLAVRKVAGDRPALAYLDEHHKPSPTQLRALVDAAPTRLIVLEDSFHGDDELKTNLAQYAKSKGVELWTA